jgi:virginiamycin B lyase
MKADHLRASGLIRGLSSEQEWNMHNKRLITVSFVLIAVLVLAGTAWAGLLAQETPLSPDGWAYELNLDSQGVLWVTDLGAGEIWSFEPTSGARRAYLVGGGPIDAHGDGAGSVWWADSDSNRLGRLSTSANQATIWEIPDSIGLYSTAIDSSGDVWVSDFFDPFIYRLDPDTNDLCSYELPDFGLGGYLHTNGQQLWFADVANARIVRLQDGALDWWNLPVDSYPLDLELDGNGRVWWTDFANGYLGRLDGGAATNTTFIPPDGGAPVMLTLSGGKVWASQQFPSRVVVLDPGAAESETAPVTAGSQKAKTVCRKLLPLAPTPVTASSGQAGWTGQPHMTALDAAGWKTYEMPANSAPWGISAADQVWLVDGGRQVLAQLGPATQTYLPLVQR